MVAVYLLIKSGSRLCFFRGGLTTVFEDEDKNLLIRMLFIALTNSGLRSGDKSLINSEGIGLNK